VGHSNHELSSFLDLLRAHQITLVADVRSQPYSRWASQFNKELLARSLREAGLAYEFLGQWLGGRPEDPALYDLGVEHPDYRRMEQTPEYGTGIDRLLALVQAHRVVIMCGEGEHHHCHRHLLIAQTLIERGVRVLHIQPDGSTVQGEQIPRQLSLF
jgi:uncharacterized protein (DUF488 family)